MPIGGVPGGGSEGMKVKKLEEVCPFLRIEKSPEERDFDAMMTKAVDLMRGGRMDEATKLIRELKSQNLQPAKEKPEFTPEQHKAFNKARGQILEQLGYTVKINREGWLILEKGDYSVQIKHFMLGGTFGVDGGRISKLQISKDDIDAVWDNGWTEEPTDAGIKKIFEELTQYIN